MHCQRTPKTSGKLPKHLLSKVCAPRYLTDIYVHADPVIRGDVYWVKHLDSCLKIQRLYKFVLDEYDEWYLNGWTKLLQLLKCFVHVGGNTGWPQEMWTNSIASISKSDSLPVLNNMINPWVICYVYSVILLVLSRVALYPSLFALQRHQLNPSCASAFAGEHWYPLAITWLISVVSDTFSIGFWGTSASVAQDLEWLSFSYSDLSFSKADHAAGLLHMLYVKKKIKHKNSSDRMHMLRLEGKALVG